MEEKWRKLVEKHRNVLIERQENFSLFFGGRGHINIAAEKACAALLLTPGRNVLISNNIEMYRLLQEEADSETNWEFRPFPWYEDARRQEIISELTGREPVVTDSEIGPEIVGLRTALSEKQIALVRELGKATAEGLEAVCRQVQRGMTEFAAAGLVAQTFLSRGIEPIVNLVGSDDRLERYRHFLPTGRAIDKHVIFSVVTRYKGLTISATRSVHFGPMNEETARKAEAIRRIDAQLTAHTQAGRRFGDLFGLLVQWYADAGYAEQWKNHHQGGLAGYLPREERLLPNSDSRIETNRMYAWNPSLPGAKSEDTTLVAETGPEVVTWSGDFPYEEFRVNDTVVKKTATLIR